MILGISSPSDVTDAAKGLFDPVKVLRSGGGLEGGGVGGGGTGVMTSRLVSLFSEGAIITSFIGFVLGKLSNHEC